MNRFPSLATPPNTGGKWSIWFKLLVLPLIPLALLMGTCMWVVISETNQPPTMIDGNPDDAPRFAAAILLFMLPVFYGIYLLGLGAAWFIVRLIRRT